MCGNRRRTFPITQLPNDSAVYVLIDAGISSETVFGLASNPAQKKGDFAFPKVKLHVNSHCCLPNRVNLSWKVLESGPPKTLFCFVSEEQHFNRGKSVCIFKLEGLLSAAGLVWPLQHSQEIWVAPHGSLGQRRKPRLSCRPLCPELTCSLSRKCAQFLPTSMVPHLLTNVSVGFWLLKSSP